ncbi:hypothetical protein KC333_g5765 [Hortaea werneckii]|nr:hypothetical protein KC333_g5765 [Hortaea werneckii]KAI7315805.1 hypothetical protein KC326_g4589 [Hortaea werneckii]
MCRIQRYRYSCYHFIDVPISKCLGSFTTSFKGPRPKGLVVGGRKACLARPCTPIRLNTPCASCQHVALRSKYTARSKAIRKEIDGLKTDLALNFWSIMESSNLSAEIDAAEARLREIEDERHVAVTTAPEIAPAARAKIKKRVWKESKKSQKRRTRGSLLKTEVKPNDLPGDWHLEATGIHEARTEALQEVGAESRTGGYVKWGSEWEREDVVLRPENPQDIQDQPGSFG